MICHKGITFCASSGSCANTDCDRWINFGEDFELPVSMAEFKDTDYCPGFIEHQVLAAMKAAMGSEP